jgi:hypothetical protein
MADSKGNIAVQSDICNLWPVDYWTAKVVAVEVQQNIAGLAERFRQSVLRATDELVDPAKRMSCGAVQHFALQALVNWERLADL